METEKSLHDCEKPQDQISFVAIGSERIIDKLRKTNVDELTDEDASAAGNISLKSFAVCLIDG